MGDIDHVKMKICRCCNGEFPIAFFPKRGAYAYAPNREYKDICFGCRQTKSDAEKNTLHGRMKKKVYGTLKRHAKKWGVTVDEFCKKYGHDLAQWLHKLEHAYQNGCPYCFHRYQDMGMGLASITLDMIDPNQDPYFTNFQWCCATCNKEKQKSRQGEWGAKLVGWRMWRDWKEFLSKDPFKAFPLFGGPLRRMGN